QFVFDEAGLTLTGDPKSGGKTRPEFWGDVWTIPRVEDGSQERVTGLSDQLPLDLLRAVIGCTSKTGDLVIGLPSACSTVGVAAIEGGRQYLGIEQDQETAERGRERLRAFSSDERDESWPSVPTASPDEPEESAEEEGPGE